eukprot:jgi/Mesen1/2446/ME000158S01639
MIQQSVVEDSGQYTSSCGYCKSAGETSVSHDLLNRGWRRSGKFVYKPAMDKTCCPPYTIRLNCKDFVASKEQRRVMSRMERYLKGVLSPPVKEGRTSTAGDFASGQEEEGVGGMNTVNSKEFLPLTRAVHKREHRQGESSQALQPPTRAVHRGEHGQGNSSQALPQGRTYVLPPASFRDNSVLSKLVCEVDAAVRFCQVVGELPEHAVFAPVAVRATPAKVRAQLKKKTKKKKEKQQQQQQQKEEEEEEVEEADVAYTSNVAFSISGHLRRLAAMDASASATAGRHEAVAVTTAAAAAAAPSGNSWGPAEVATGMDHAVEGQGESEEAGRDRARCQNELATATRMPADGEQLPPGSGKPPEAMQRRRGSSHVEDAAGGGGGGGRAGGAHAVAEMLARRLQGVGVSLPGGLKAEALNGHLNFVSHPQPQPQPQGQAVAMAAVGSSPRGLAEAESKSTVGSDPFAPEHMQKLPQKWATDAHNTHTKGTSGLPDDAHKGAAAAGGGEGFSGAPQGTNTSMRSCGGKEKLPRHHHHSHQPHHPHTRMKGGGQGQEAAAATAGAAAAAEVGLESSLGGLKQEGGSSAASSRGGPTAPSKPKEGATRELQVTLARSAFDAEEFQLFKKYQVAVHGDKPGSVTPAHYRRFLVDSPLIPVAPRADGSTPPCGFGSFHQQYRVDGRLIAVGVVDILPTCLSSKYLFWDPEYAFLSPGKYSALQEVAWVRAAGGACASLAYYYLGYYIHNCPKMKYKAAYAPSELLCPLRFQWVPYSVAEPLLDRTSLVFLSSFLPRPRQTASICATTTESSPHGHGGAPWRRQGSPQRGEGQLPAAQELQEVLGDARWHNRAAAAGAEVA